MSSTTAVATEGVVLLHGLCRTPASMLRMEAELNKAGYVVLNQGYPSRSASVEALSDATVGAVLEDPKLADCGKIHFVAHSLGGILVRSYFKRHRDDRLGRVVMLGPPNQGSEIVDRIGHWRLFRMINGPAGNELGTHPNSTPNQLGPVDFELGVIAGDRSINWINSLMIRGADDGKMSVARTRTEGMADHVVVHATHPFIMKRKAVIELTLRFLRSGRFEPSPG